MLTTSTYHLVCQNQDRLQVKLAVEAIKEIFKGRAKTFKDHGVVIAFCSKPVNGWDTDATYEAFIDLVFVVKLRVLRIDRLELDSNVLFRNNIDSAINDTL
jgi:hypothetical protein